MNKLNINTTEYNLYLRTSENTYELKESKRKEKYIPLSYDIVKKTITNAEDEENNNLRLRLYIKLNDAEIIDYQNDYFTLVVKKAHDEIAAAIDENNILQLSEHTYLQNTYYTIFKPVKGKEVNWK